jgi:hypothetical protein
MARKVSNPGRTAKFYRDPKNKASREKHIRDNSNGGKYDKPASYQREHANAREKLKIGPNQDAVRKNGKLVAGNRYQNRADGGRKGARNRA